MSKFLTTRQIEILQTLDEGGHIKSVYDEEGWAHSLVDKNNENSYIQRNTLISLHKRKYIIEFKDHPCFGASKWLIGEEGKKRLYGLIKERQKRKLSLTNTQ